MSIKDKYYVNSVTYDQCKEWLMYKHYAKRMSLITYSFGLYDKEHILQGICTFGLASPKINGGKSIFNTYESTVIELNRLVVNDDLDKNVLSYFVSICLKSLPKNICVISFADPSNGHHGYIYQATNWIYTGRTEKGGKNKNYILNNTNYHALTITEKWFEKLNYVYDKNKTLTDNWISIGGIVEDFELKYRYIKILYPKKTRDKMIKDLKHKPLKYPKGNNKRYDSSYKTLTQTKLF